MTIDYPRKLRFKCVKCGTCCGDTHEKTRHVLLLKEEADHIASATKQPVDFFSVEVKDKAPYRYEMKKTPEDGKCVFLRQNRCSIYSKRPLICRFYPIGLQTIEQQQVFYHADECQGIGKGEPLRESDFKRLVKLANRRARKGGRNEG